MASVMTLTFALQHSQEKYLKVRKFVSINNVFGLLSHLECCLPVQNTTLWQTMKYVRVPKPQKALVTEIRKTIKI